jgi:endonuclease YncB( thermonuclease family)
MFGWRRKTDGFVWHEYVRTTILVRRDQRRQKVENIRDAAVDGVKNAGRQGVALSAAGLNAAARGAAQGVEAAYFTCLDMSVACARATGVWLTSSLGPGAQALAARTGAGLHALMHVLARPALATPLLLVGAAAGLSAGARWSTSGFDPQAVIAATAAAIAGGLVVLPWVASWAQRTGWSARTGALLSRLPGVARMPAGLSGAILAGVALIAIAGGGAWIANRSGAAGGNTAAVAPASKAGTGESVALDGKLDGRAVALSGDLLRVGGTLVRLSGIEAPERKQDCSGAGIKKWACGAAAKTALQKLVAGKKVVCEVSGRQEQMFTRATCQVNGADLAGQLVRGGHVFAASGLFATHANAEAEARAAKLGLWKGDPLRPTAWRTQKWDEAKRAAPDGCPIKGQVADDARTYLVPWSSNYEKAKVRQGRGERWFCSEDEARAAGWKPVEPS